MALPNTASLALAGPIEVPETDGGRSWFISFDDDWELIQPTKAEKRRLHSLASTLQLLQKLIASLIAVGWEYQQLQLFGFSQGGSTALALHRCYTGSQRLGGCVSISGPIIEEQLWELEASPRRGKASSQGVDDGCGPTLITWGSRDDVVPRSLCDRSGKASSQGLDDSCGPTLSTWGSRDDVVPRSLCDRTVRVLNQDLSSSGADGGSNGGNTSRCARMEVVNGKGHAMLSSEAETRLCMAFWSQTLPSSGPGPMAGPGVFQVKTE
eukprot:gene15722-21842_t